MPLALRALLLGAVAARADTPATPPAAREDEADGSLEEVVVFGRAEYRIGIAAAASEGAVGGADFEVRPMLRVAELLEAVPGLIAAQHSGSGKANQYFLRGFNLDHGTDFTTYIDDVPMNLRTHGHGQGYLDLNGLIPESVARIDYRKGPYRADVGDFALAGASFITTISTLPRPYLAAETGQYGWQRLSGGASFGVGTGELLLLGQWKTYDGPWQEPERLRHESGYAKYAQMTGLGRLELSLSAYRADWDPTEQIPERAIGTAVCRDAFCALDPTATGHTTRFVGAARLMGEGWRATLYGQYYDWNMYSNPTYAYQLHQWDSRHVYGGRYERRDDWTEWFSVTTGAEARYDDIGKVEVDHTVARQFVSYLSPYAAREGSAATYAEATLRPLPGLRLLGGLRVDGYGFDAHATQPGFPSGSTDRQLLSPKLGVAWAFGTHVETYANWGRGFHSNDARAVAAATPAVQGLVPGTGYEAGARLQYATFNLSIAYWWLTLGSELRFDGDTNSVAPGPPSHRRGYELVGFWRPWPWLALDGVWTATRARYDAGPGASHVPGAVENAGELGVAIVRDRWQAGIRLRHLGPYPLLEDDSQRATAENVLNLRVAWKPRSWTLYAELLNVLNRHGKDVVYDYATHVDGLDPPGVEVDGRVSRAEEPRTLRAGLKYEL